MGCSGQATEFLIKGTNPNQIPETIIKRLYNSIARIVFKINNQNKISTGFFIKLNIFEKNYNFLLTCHHSISIENVDSKIDINVYYGKVENETKIEIKLDREKRFIKCYESLDSTLIQIYESDNIPENKYLSPDLNYKNGLLQYEKTQIYTGGYPNVDDIHMGEKHLSAGIITKIRDTDFEHTCDTRQGSSGSPLINKNKNVVGIHYGANKDQSSNYGTFICFIIDSLISDLKEKEEKDKIEEKKRKIIEKEKEKKLKEEEKKRKEEEKKIEEEKEKEEKKKRWKRQRRKKDRRR